MNTKPTLTLHDLGTYLAALWVLTGNRKIPTHDRFHQSICRVFDELRDKLEKNYQLPFRLLPHQIYGDSEQVAEMLLRIQHHHGYMRFPSGNNIHLELNHHDAESLLAEIPADVRAVLKELATRSLEEIKPE